jgi:putative aldouronate transport system substrate-binding protein
MKDTTQKAVSRRGFIGRAGAVGAVAVTVPAVLSACGGGDGGADAEVVGDASYEPGTAELKVQLGEEVEGINYPPEYEGPKARALEPFGDGETEFSVLTRTIPELDYDTNYYAQHLEETTGVKIAYEPVPLGDDGVTTVNAMLAGGELPHALMTGMGLFSVSQVAVYGQQGMFLPLDKLIDEHAPHIREMFDMFPQMRQQFTSPDGRLYAVPSMNDCYHCKSHDVRTWYNSRWLEGVGASVPETLEDYDALMAEWAGSGSIPGGAALTVTNADTMMNLFNFFLGSFTEVSTTHTLLRDGKVTWVPTEDAYREGMIWIQEQFSKGHFSPGILSMTPEQLRQLGDDAAGPQFGVVHGGSQGSWATVVDFENPDSSANIMKPLPPMAGPAGVRTCHWDWYQIGSPNFVITTSCPDPVQMIRWADYQFELGMTIAMARGERGVGWDFSDVGTTGIDGEQAVYEVLPGSADLTNYGWWEWGPFFKSTSQRHGEAVLEGSSSVEPSLFQAGKAYEPYRVPQELKVPTLAFDMDQSAQIGEIETNLVQHLEQSFAAAASGSADFTKDADWQSYVEQFTTIGVDNLLAIYQEAYDAQS